MNSVEFSSSFNSSPQDDDARRDAELVNAARAGSNTAFEQLQSIYSRRLYRKILSITKSCEDAEDALQETFLRAYVGLNSFEGRARFSSWLTKIAINSALMTLRKRRCRAEISVELPVDTENDSPKIDVRDNAMNPEEICDQEERCNRMLRAIHRLDPQLRTALGVWMSQRSSMKEIAQIMGVSMAAVKARLHRARKRLRGSPAFKDYKATLDSVGGGNSGFSLLNCEQPRMNLNEAKFAVNGRGARKRRTEASSVCDRRATAWGLADPATSFSVPDPFVYSGMGQGQIPSASSPADPFELMNG